MLSQFPPGLRNIALLIAVMGLAQITLTRMGSPPYFLYLFYPDSDQFKPWQLITHMFAHGNIAHFLFNTIALISFGAIIELKLGTRRFLILYFLSGMGAVLLHYLSVGYQVWDMTGTAFPHLQGLIPGEGPVLGIQQGARTIPYGPMLGASGAIYGIMAAFAFFYPNEEMIFLFIPYPIKAKYLVPIIVAIDLVFGISDIKGDPIAHFAHLGGAITGFVTVWIWFRQWMRRRWT